MSVAKALHTFLVIDSWDVREEYLANVTPFHFHLFLDSNRDRRVQGLRRPQRRGRERELAMDQENIHGLYQAFSKVRISFERLWACRMKSFMSGAGMGSINGRSSTSIKYYYMPVGYYERHGQHRRWEVNLRMLEFEIVLDG